MDSQTSLTKSFRFLIVSKYFFSLSYDMIKSIYRSYFLPPVNRIFFFYNIQLQHSHYDFLFIPVLTYPPEPYVSISFLYRHFVDIILNNAFFPNVCLNYLHLEYYISTTKRLINKIPIVFCILYLFSVRFFMSFPVYLSLSNR